MGSSEFSWDRSYRIIVLENALDQVGTLKELGLSKKCTVTNRW